MKYSVFIDFPTNMKPAGIKRTNEAISDYCDERGLYANKDFDWSLGQNQIEFTFENKAEAALFRLFWEGAQF